jgi:hypothetical protein
MLSIRYIAVTGHVWLTAIMTLVAGLPHWQCLCPNGTTKSARLELTAQACCGNGDCCGKRCCSAGRATVAKQNETRNCCKQLTAAASQKSDGQPTMQTAGCSRSLAANDQIAVSPSKRADVYQNVLLQSPALGHSTPMLMPAAHSPTVWETHLLVPCTDRVLTFSRLVI